MKNIYQSYTYLLVVICFLSITACQNITGPSLVQPYKSNASLTNSYWKLLEVNKQKILVNEGQKEAFIQLRKNSQLRGFTGCNQIKARYHSDIETAKQALKFNNINTTRKSCPTHIQQEQNILSMLNTVKTYKISGDNLFLYNKSNDVIAKLAAIYF